jgi:Tol biopolymer transport system component
LHLISLDGEDLGLLATEIGPDAALSPDGTRIAYLTGHALSTRLSITDIRDGSTFDLPGSYQNASAHVWSPTGDQLAVSIWETVWLVDLPSGERSLLFDCEQLHGGGNCRVTSWSPDGRWIAYDLWFGRAGGEPDPLEGVYVLDTRCLVPPPTCRDDARGPLLTGSSTSTRWTPSGRLLQVVQGDEVVSFDVDTWTIVSEGSLRMADPGAWLPGGWSPDGEWIAYNVNEEVWVISQSTGEQRLVFTAPGTIEEVLFWLPVPPAHDG